MFLLWIILVILHQGFADALVPVVTVQLGEPVTLSCAFTEKFQSTTWLHWYKQTAGDTLKLIVMQQKTIKPNYEPDVSASRIKAKNDENFSNLTILKTVLQDEGMYHCAHMDWTETTWTGTYLSIKGNSLKASNYTVLQNRTASDSTRPARSETLQCSVLSETETENQNCSEEPIVFWFRTGSEQSYPEIIHTDDKGLHKCENTSTSKTQKKCSHNFSLNFNSSDSGTVYCAVATCGEILFGEGTKIRPDHLPSSTVGVLIIVLICLAISVIINIGFICQKTQRPLCRNVKAKDNESQPGSIIGDGQDMNYAALHFDDGQHAREKKNRQLKTNESVYSQVKGVI